MFFILIFSIVILNFNLLMRVYKVFNAPDFDPIAFINKTFPTEADLTEQGIAIAYFMALIIA